MNLVFSHPDVQKINLSIHFSINFQALPYVTALIVLLLYIYAIIGMQVTFLPFIRPLRTAYNFNFKHGPLKLCIFEIFDVPGVSIQSHPGVQFDLKPLDFERLM